MVGHGPVGDYGVLSGEKAVMGIESGVEQIEAIEFAEDDRIQHIVDRQWVVGVLGLDLFKALKRAIVIKDIEALEGLAHLRVQVKGVRIHLGRCGNCATSRCPEKHQENG